MDIARNMMQITQILYEPISKQIKYVTDLRENIETLVKEAEILESKRKDIEIEGEEASRNGLRLLNQAEKWVEEAAQIESEIISLKLEFEERRAIFKECFPDYLSRYKLGKRAVKKLKDAKDVLGRGDFGRVVASSSPPRVLEMPTASTDGQSTAEKTLEKIWGHLHDDHSGIISLYGMGGIGKTTLMKTINNRLIDSQEFHIVIWINVSKDYNSERVQKEIMTRLGLNFKDDESQERRHSRLYDRLKSRRYMLILDDLWEDICLDQIGIPRPEMQNRSKIVITTRSVDVCNAMEADVMIKVKTLTRLEGWNLFLDKVGEVGLLPDIQLLAEEIVMECAGLPLAISVVGRAMRGKKKEELWQNALRALRGSAPEIPGMEPKVFLPLKLSYDHLDDKIKMCFLYCSLFPEDYEIDIDELVTYLIMEGLIDNVYNLVDASNKGHQIIERIKDACLLEEGIRGHKYVVKMHDLIRDLALWITSSSSSNQGPKFLVRAAVDLKEAPQEEMWIEIGRISLMRNWITCLPPKPNCRNLISLLMRENPYLNVIPSGFFELMPRLQILDLSYTSVDSLSVSFSSLVNLHALILRSCKRLKILPLLGELKELQFLDLSHSSIVKLPPDMENLVKLKKLNLSYLEKLKRFPQNVLPRLTNMEDLRIFETYVKWAREGEANASVAKLDEIATLTHLSTLEITVRDIDCLVQDVFPLRWSALKKFKISIGSMCLNEVEDDLPCAKVLRISDRDFYAQGVQVMLPHVEGLILRWINAKSVSQLIGDLNNLRMIRIGSCNEMKCIIDWREVGVDSLQNIEEFDLLNLPNITKLFRGEMPEGITWKLRKIVIDECNMLRSLFSSEMVKHLDQLEVLHVMHCDALKEIIEGTESLPRNPFPRLCSLKLIDLCRLRRIFRRRTMALPSLIEFYKESCPKLRLPKCPSIADILSKKGQQLEAMEWEDDKETSFVQSECSTTRLETSKYSSCSA